MTVPMQLKEKQDTPQKRGLVGPGTTAMLLALICIGGFNLLSKPKVTIERRVETSAGAKLLRRPSISELISMSAELHITADQKNVLLKLAKEQQTSLAPVEADINQKMHNFNEFTQSRKTDGVGLAYVQEAAKPISQLGRQKRQMEQLFGEQALAVLSPSQREAAVRLWQEKQPSNKAKATEVVSP
ncbi:MAG: hypothetical protein SGJ27_28250 [Candidatus Melainabacteria bacterium]|nr:hypothetical protein [Candidatus Melainabacteria bacterium]